MLILSRREGERILIGDGVVITVVDILLNKVRIGIEAPDAVSIDREEIRAARIKSGLKLGHGKLGRGEHDVRGGDNRKPSRRNTQMTPTELFDFGRSVARLTHQELHGDAPGDWHEQEFVKAMRQDGVIPPEKSEND